MSQFRIRRGLHRFGIPSLQITSGARDLREYQRRSAIVDRLIEDGNIEVLRGLHNKTIPFEEVVYAIRYDRHPGSSEVRPRVPADRGFIYVIHRPDTSEVKIGFTRDVASRFKGIQTYNGAPLQLVASFSGTRRDERALHGRFAAHRKMGEWFHATPEILNWVASIGKEGAA